MTRRHVYGALLTVLALLSGSESARAAQIFTDGFESGDTAAWSSAVGDNLIVGAAAAMSGNFGLGGGASVFGLEVVFDGSPAPSSVQDDTPAGEPTLLADFLFNANELQMPQNASQAIFQARCKGAIVIAIVMHCRQGDCGPGQAGRYFARLLVREDSGALVSAGNLEVLPSTPTNIGFHWSRGGGDGDGSVLLWRDGRMRAAAGVDNDTLCVDGVSLGAPGGVDPAITGSYFLDEYVSLK